MTGQGALAEEVSLAYDCNGCLFANLGYNGQADFTFLDIKDSVGVVALRKYRLSFRNDDDFPAVADGREEDAGIKCFLGCDGDSHLSQV